MTYRHNVCAILFNEDREILACFRKDKESYQFVQGGIEPSEETNNPVQGDKKYEAAARREIFEEIGVAGTNLITFVGQIHPPGLMFPNGFRYDFPASHGMRRKGYLGQEQEVLLFFMKKADIVHCDVGGQGGARQEFEHVRWMPSSEFVRVCGSLKAVVSVAALAQAEPLMKRFLSTTTAVGASNGAKIQKRSRNEKSEEEGDEGDEEGKVTTPSINAAGSSTTTLSLPADAKLLNPSARDDFAQLTFTFSERLLDASTKIQCNLNNFAVDTLDDKRAEDGKTKKGVDKRNDDGATASATSQQSTRAMNANAKIAAIGEIDAEVLHVAAMGLLRRPF